MPYGQQDEHAYLLKRSASHRRQADTVVAPDLRALHERFAAAYAQRAAEIVVEGD